MGQCASALLGPGTRFLFTDVVFDRPIIVPNEGTLTIRLAALVNTTGAVDVAIRSAETNFEVDHVRARCALDEADGSFSRSRFTRRKTEEQGIDSAPLYDNLFFQRGRFRCVDTYRDLRARTCTATLIPCEKTQWFGDFHPQLLLLGDPGQRDAAIHSVQACLPHRTVVPARVARISIGTRHQHSRRIVSAKEVAWTIAGERGTYVYDLTIRAEAKPSAAERWQGLELRTIGSERLPTVLAVVAPYVERKLGELLPTIATEISVQLELRDVVYAARRAQRERRLLLGGSVSTAVADIGEAIAYSNDCAFVVTGRNVLACDMEEVVPLEREHWREMLTPALFELARYARHEAGESIDAACGRLWCAGECLTKAGLFASAPMVLRAVRDDGWIVFATGDATIATCVIAPRDAPRALALAVMLRGSQP
jgi:enediyne polyketide synthase